MAFELARRKLKKLFEDHQKRICEAAQSHNKPVEYIKKNFDEYESVFESQEIDRVFNDIENELEESINPLKETIEDLKQRLDCLEGDFYES